MKRFLGITMIFMMLFSLFPAAMFAAENTIEGTEQTVKFTIGQKGYSVGSTQVATDVAPYIKDGRTMVPVAFVAPALGTDKAVWLPESQTVSITRGTDHILIKIGSKELIVNGKTLLMDTAAEMKSVGNGGGRTMLPISFIAKALEIGFQWDGATSSVNFFGYSKTFDTKGTYGPETGTLTVEGNVVVKADGVIMQNIIVKGNLIIAKEVGDGTVTLDNITVLGETFVRGGGIHSIRITGNSHLQNITIARVDGEIRVYAEDGTQIGEVTVDGNDDVIIEGNFGTVTIAASDVTVTATGAEIVQATIEGDRSTLLVNDQSTIATARIDGEDARVVTQGGTNVGNIIANGSGASISGTGTVGTVDANANDIHVTTTGTEVTAGTGSTGIMAGSKTVESGGSEIVGGQSGSGGGGGGGGSNTHPEITNISLAANAGLQVGNANVAANAEIGTLSTTGGTAAFSYQLIADAGTPANSADNASFAIATNKLKVAAGGALAAAKDYKVTVKVTDSKSKTYTKGFTVTVAAAYKAVTSITGAPTTGTAGTEVDLTAATVNPADATNKTIVWTVKDAGTTGVATEDLASGKFTPATAGTLVLTATITNGATASTNYTQDVTITVAAAYKAVTSITGAPTTGTSGTEVDLTAVTVNPADATNKTIVWTVKDAGTTGVATEDLASGKFTPATAGTLVLTATITNGATASTNYTQDFTITVAPEFTFTSAAGEITAYNGTSAVVVIPSEIGGVAVTVIGPRAFADNTAISSITIPNGVTDIGSNAFDGCTELESITIPNGVFIYNYAFVGCTALTSITVGSDVIVQIDMLDTGGNNFQTAYNEGGAGTYTGTYAGAWTKQ